MSIPTPPPPPGSEPPVQRAPYSPPEAPPLGANNGDSQKTIAPAIAMMAAGGMSLMLSIFTLVQGASVEEMLPLFEQFYEMLGIDTSQLEQMSGFMEKYMDASTLMGAVFAIFMIYAGTKMRKKQGWGICVAGSIVAMLPCGSCCCINLPIGIWALVILLKDDVKHVFT